MENASAKVDTLKTMTLNALHVPFPAAKIATNKTNAASASRIKISKNNPSTYNVSALPATFPKKTNSLAPPVSFKFPAATSAKTSKSVKPAMKPTTLLLNPTPTTSAAASILTSLKIPAANCVQPTTKTVNCVTKINATNAKMGIFQIKTKRNASPVPKPFPDAATALTLKHA